MEYEFSYAAAEQEVGGWGRQLGPLHTERCEQAGGTVMCHVAGSGFRTNEEDVAKWQRVAAGHVCIPCLSDWACEGGPGFGESTCAEGHTGIMCGICIRNEVSLVRVRLYSVLTSLHRLKNTT